jgi:hypothetical protein
MRGAFALPRDGNHGEERPPAGEKARADGVASVWSLTAPGLSSASRRILRYAARRTRRPSSFSLGRPTDLTPAERRTSNCRLAADDRTGRRREDSSVLATREARGG